MTDKYTVWVRGVEVNNNLMPKEEAVKLANSYRKQGYKDVHVEKYYTISSQLKSYLWQEFAQNNLPKYYKYFEQWVSNLTNNQIAYFAAYMLERKTIINLQREQNRQTL